MGDPEVIDRTQVRPAGGSTQLCVYFVVAQISKAVAALLAYFRETKGKEMSLLNENEVISLQIAVKKISQASVKPKRM